jgi:putative phage-type endonuclease
MKTPKRIEWLRERKTYIGGTDIGCILGLSPYKTPLDIFREKTTEVIDESISEAAYWGIAFEDIVAQEYSKRTGLKNEKPAGLMRHPEHKFLAANIDRWVVGNDQAFVLECKTAGFHKNKEWGEEGTNQIPQLYLCQVAYYAAICDVPRVDIAVLIGGQNFRIYTYLKDKEFEEKLVRAACAFWNNYVLKGIAPSASNLGDVTTLYPKSNGLAIQADREVVADVEELKAIKEREKILATNKATLEAKIKSCIGENELLMNEVGEVLATWKSGQARQVLDAFRLQKEQQGIYQQYLVEREAPRTFLIK